MPAISVNVSRSEATWLKTRSLARGMTLGEYIRRYLIHPAIVANVDPVVKIPRTFTKDLRPVIVGLSPGQEQFRTRQHDEFDQLVAEFRNTPDSRINTSIHKRPEYVWLILKAMVEAGRPVSEVAYLTGRSYGQVTAAVKHDVG